MLNRIIWKEPVRFDIQLLPDSGTSIGTSNLFALSNNHFRENKSLDILASASLWSFSGVQSEASLILTLTNKL